MLIQGSAKTVHWPKAYEVGYFCRRAVFDSTERGYLNHNDIEDHCYFIRALLGLKGFSLVIQGSVKTPHWPKAYEVGYSSRRPLFEANSRGDFNHMISKTTAILSEP